MQNPIQDLKIIGKSVVFILLAVVLAGGCRKKTEPFTISGEWISETIPSSRVSAGYMEITNQSGKDDVLVRVEAEDFELAEFHNMVDDQGVMRMEALDYVNIASGETVRFSPGGMHIMLINGRKELKAGSMEPLILHFQNGGAVKKLIAVKNIQEQVK